MSIGENANLKIGQGRYTTRPGETNVIPIKYTLRQHGDLPKYLALARFRLEDLWVSSQHPVSAAFEYRYQVSYLIEGEIGDLLPLLSRGRLRLIGHRDLALTRLLRCPLIAIGNIRERVGGVGLMR